MELAEYIETINGVLVDAYGIDTITGQPIWRVVWSNDQYEKRLVDKTDSGIILIHPEVREVPKYPHNKDRYILERLSLIPIENMKELPASKVSYEPIWTFMDNQGNYLPPKILAAQFVIDTVHAALGKKSLAKYKDPDAGLKTDEVIQKNLARVQAIELELFGNETDVTDALAYGTGVVVPNSYHTTKEN
jgi:hypothetical protein